MRKTLLIVLAIIILPLLVNSQNYENAGMDYSKALFENKTAASRIKALKNYIQNYTDTSNKFVRLAHYQLSLNFFEVKNYKNAIKTGLKTLSLGSLGTGEEARLNLVLANSYGIKSFSGFNKDKALKYTNKAISLGKKANDNNVVKTAKNLKKSLTGPPPKILTPEQKIRKFYTEDDYRGAVNYFKSLGSSDRSNNEIGKIYGYSLFKLKRYDSALAQFKNLYESSKTGTYAKYIADIYSKKARKKRSLYQNSTQYYLEASVLYKKEGSSGNQKIAAGKAKVMLENKHGYKAKYNSYQKQLKAQKSSTQKHASEIRALKKKIRAFKRYMRKTYRDVQAPQYEYDKLEKMESKLQSLESGGGVSNSGASKSGEELVKLRKKIDDEYEKMLTAAKEKFEQK